MTELEKLAQMLEKEGIPYVQYEDQVVYLKTGGDPSNQRDYISDVVCHKRSHGYEEGLLEVYGRYDSILDYLDLPIDPEETYGRYLDTTLGYLTAEQVFEMWKKHYYDMKNNQ